MVLHELAVNAAKHGALASRDGKLKVTWQDEGEAKLLSLAWEESAVSASVARQSSGYGTALIDTTITTLGGSVERSHKDGLFSVRVTIPLGL
jgi:two-component sensor histidine kinase